MGTNYYIHGPTCSCCGRADPPQHLGKSSMGWAFAFKGNRDPDFGPVISTFEEWRRDAAEKLAHGWVIQDEYGEVVALEELLKLIESKRGGRCATIPSHRDRYDWYDPEGHFFLENEFS